MAAGGTIERLSKRRATTKLPPFELKKAAQTNKPAAVEEADLACSVRANTPTATEGRRAARGARRPETVLATKRQLEDAPRGQQ